MLLPTHERGGVEFDFGGVPADATISKATLLLTLLPSGVDAGDAAEVHGYLGDGVVAAADLNTVNQVGSFSGPIAGSTTLEVPIDVGFIQSLVDSNALFAGFMVQGVGTPGNSVVFMFWGTSTAVPPEDRPPAPELRDRISTAGAGTRLAAPVRSRYRHDFICAAGGDESAPSLPANQRRRPHPVTSTRGSDCG